eukprot:5960663-Prymnesium_polylepis.1
MVFGRAEVVVRCCLHSPKLFRQFADFGKWTIDMARAAEGHGSRSPWLLVYWPMAGDVARGGIGSLRAPC